MKPYEIYAEVAEAKTYRRWDPKLKYFVAFFAIAGLIYGLYLRNKGDIGRDQQYLVIFVFFGAVAGYLAFRVTVFKNSRVSADTLFANDWCDEHGMHYRGSNSYPKNAPLAFAGDRREATNAIEGEMNGLQTLFYNFKYTNEAPNGIVFNYYFRIMRLKGRDVPIRRMTFQKRGFLDNSAVIDSIQEMFSKEKSISMESITFNSTWDLTIDKDADQIWIRRVFDPATITALVQDEFKIPNFYFYDHCWWFVEEEHFKVRDLDDWIPRQKLAADAVKHLSRVQSL